jgi:hypothetical protein
MITGRRNRKPLTEEEYERMDKLLRECPDLDFGIIAIRCNCDYTTVQSRNKKIGIRVFKRNTKSIAEKPRTRVGAQKISGNFL